MDQRSSHPRTPLPFAQATGLALATALWAGHAQAQGTPTAPTHGDWQQCSQLSDDKEARLACFDAWAQHQASMPASGATSATALKQGTQPTPSSESATLQALAPATQPPCKSPQFTTLSRFWELEPDTDCGTLTLRGYRPISLSIAEGSSVNKQPTSGNPLNNAAEPRDYQHGETRIQLSVRTKLAQNLLVPEGAAAKDSLWFGYTQQSYWQLFNADLSRPFRNTDHEPEIVYIYPSDIALPMGWRMRYSGVALTHQSNGQSLPLSRSWDRMSLMAGMEKGDTWSVTGRIWKRRNERADLDDNPNISDYIGRAELSTAWNVNQDNTLVATVRHSMKRDARGSVRLEWLRALGTSRSPHSGLRFHTQLFSGYGDSMIDFNYRRTVLNIGLSLVDF